MPSPMCWATSRERVLRLAAAASSSVSSLLYISGIESTGNSTSTTGPITRAIRPALAGARCVLGLFNRGSHVSHSLLTRLAALASASALTPPTISLISWVMPAWRAWLATRVYFLMSSSALSVADFIAFCRAASSEAAAWSSAKKIRLWTYCGSSPSSTASGDGSNS